jgi:hypothetical protein
MISIFHIFSDNIIAPQEKEYSSSKAYLYSVKKQKHIYWS